MAEVAGLGPIKNKLDKAREAIEGVRDTAQILKDRLAESDDPELTKSKRMSRTASINLFTSFADAISLLEDAVTDIIPVCESRHDSLTDSIHDLFEVLADTKRDLISLKKDFQEYRDIKTTVRTIGGLGRPVLLALSLAATLCISIGIWIGVNSQDLQKATSKTISSKAKP